jgi:hypothetical protein
LNIVQIGNIPMLKLSVRVIIAYLLDGFGNFEISRLFATGSFLRYRNTAAYMTTQSSQKWKRSSRDR